MADLLWSYAGFSAGNRSFAAASMARACGGEGFTFVRFAALPFWPDQLISTNVLTNATAFLALSSELVADARAAGCRLMPSLFWQAFEFPDAFGEPAGVAFDAQLRPSRARDAMEAFATTYVAHFALDDTIIAWELGNEYNLFYDLNMTEQQPLVCTACGTPPFRTNADNISTAAGGVVQDRLLAVIHAADPQKRPISSGHAVARIDATWRQENYAEKRSPYFQDSPAQFLAITQLQQRGVELLSQHIYPGPDVERFGLITDPYSPALLDYSRVAAVTGQTLVVAEFGDDAPGNRTFARNVLALFNAWHDAGPSAGAPFFGLVWAWEMLQQASSYALWPGVDDSLIAAIVAHNAKMAPPAA
jgi:hypothetical protein